MPRPHLDYHELLDSLRKEGCPACDQGALAARRFLDSLLNDMVMNNLHAQRLLADSFGLCGAHAARAAEMGRVLSAAIVWDLVAGALLRALEAAPARGLFKREEPLVPSAPCPACEAEREMGDLTLLSLADHWQDGQVQEAYQRSEGLCRPHLTRVAAVLGRRPEAALIREAEREKVRQLRADLQEFMRKQDYRYAHEPPGREADAHLRAARKFGGRALMRGEK